MIEPLRLPEKFVHPRRVFLERLLATVVAAFLFGVFTALHLTDVSGQQAIGVTPFPERMARVETRQEDAIRDIHNLQDDVALNRRVVDSLREKDSSIERRLAVVEGIGIGMSSIWLIIQVVSFVSNRRKLGEDAS